MPKHRLPEGDRRDMVGFRLPRWMIDWLESKGQPIGKQVEEILLEIHRKEKESEEK